MREFSVVDTLKEIRFDMIDRADPSLNYAKALQLVLDYLAENNIDFNYPSQYHNAHYNIEQYHNDD